MLLLMKFIDNFFSDRDAGWKTWLLSEVYPFDCHLTAPYSYLWRIIADELNTYRSITYVILGKGASTSSDLITGFLVAPCVPRILPFFPAPPCLIFRCVTFSLTSMICACDLG